MEEDKSFIYTIILGACLIGCLILIGKIMLSKSVPEYIPYSVEKAENAENLNSDESENLITLTENTLSELISNSLPQDFPVSNLQVKVQLPNILSFTGEVEQTQLKKYMSKMGLDTNAALNAALLVIPDRFSLKADVSVDLDKETNLPIFTIEHVQAGRARISNSAFEQVIFDPLNQILNQVLCEKSIDFHEIIWKDGFIQLKK